ncbi:MAG TPA: condensation domain-containing protein [Bryobacteraceae bacterium]|nr:condensation domain-containing protein [Bryobacteraceae bacterium]
MVRPVAHVSSIRPAKGLADAPIPLSSAQLRIWFSEQLHPGNGAYVIAMGYRLSGPLDFDAMTRSFSELVTRHEPLRTTFGVSNDGIPFQAIAPATHALPSVVDLRELSEEKREIPLRISEEMRRPTDLNLEPAFRASVYRLSLSENILLLLIHHIACDGWSVPVLLRELGLLYEGEVSGERATLPALPIRYADFALWQSDWLKSHEAARQLAYWQHQLSGGAVLALPLDRPRPSVQTFHAARTELALPNGLSRALIELGNREHCTLFMVILAALAVLLHQYSGQTDIMIGTPVANRNRPELEGLVGVFINTLVLRIDLSHDVVWRQLLRHVFDVCLDAYDHQDFPFEKLVGHLRLERDVSRAPLFQVLITFRDSPVQELVLPGLSVVPMPLDADTTKYDLRIVVDALETVTLTAEYNIELFEASTAERMLEHLRRLLEDMAADVSHSLSGVPRPKGCDAGSI